MNQLRVSVPLAGLLALSLLLTACKDNNADNKENDSGSSEPALHFEGCDEPVELDKIANRKFRIAPYLINPTTDGVTIQWEAKDNAPSYLVWGLEGGDKTCVCLPAPKKIPVVSDEITEQHDGWLYSITLHGLAPHTRYKYTVPGAQVPQQNATNALLGKVDWEAFGEASFLTAPKPGTDFSMIIYGDNQPLTFNHKLVLDSILLHPADVVVHMGDIVHDGRISEFRNIYFSMASPVLRQIPHFHIAGNHERHGEKIPFDTLLPMPPGEPVTADGKTIDPGPRVGIFDYGNVRIFALDSEREQGEGSAQLAWLNAQLKETVTHHPEFKWLFATWHRPTYTWSTSLMKGPREALHKVLKRWRVDAVLNGHNHCYERFLQDDITYIVSGGGGAALSAIDAVENPPAGEHRMAAALSFHSMHGVITSTQATFTVIDSQTGKEIDKFKLLPRDRSDLREVQP